ncbi:MAG TPA: hypothetical protein VLI05_07125 [Candidatus Saccharimonadia bacterium]|nr:hypothetical protein [Candidatus Saccharimonadia bacterium]
MRPFRSERGSLALTLALLLVVLVVASLAIYNVRRGASRQTQTAITSSPSPRPVASATPAPMLVIKELEVEIPLQNGPSDLRYQMITLSDGETAAALDTAQIAQAPHCSPGQLGSLVKVSGTIPGDKQPFHTTDESGKNLNFLLKQYDGFYVQHVPSQNACSLSGGGIYPDRAAVLEAIRAVNGLRLFR